MIHLLGYYRRIFTMSNFVYQLSEDSDFLMHHGIKGQKWGEQNGPPYPLNPSKDYSKAEQKANAKILVKEYKKAKLKNMHSIKAANEISKNKIILENVNDLKGSQDKIDRIINKLDKIAEKHNKGSFDYNHPIVKELDQAQVEYNKQLKKLANNIVGEYGNIKVGSWKPTLLSKRYKETISDRVETALQIAADREFKTNDIYDKLDKAYEKLGLDY